MSYREYINQLKAEWIGKKAQYTETTAVGIGQVRLNPPFAPVVSSNRTERS